MIPAVVFFAALLVESRFAAQRLHTVRGWWQTGVLFFGFSLLVNGTVTWGVAALLQNRSLFHFAWVPVVPGALFGYLVADFFGYWLHRAMHCFSFLWRWTHQMHHSAERMDLAGLWFAHPFDTLLTFTTTSLAAALLGLTPSALGLSALLSFASALVQHSNIRTPRWIGLFVMRPEAHGLHHARGVTGHNYANAPLWDVVFGTFHNPEHFPKSYGLWDGASAQLGAMLLAKDVTKTLTNARSIAGPLSFPSRSGDES